MEIWPIDRRCCFCGATLGSAPGTYIPGSNMTMQCYPCHDRIFELGIQPDVTRYASSPNCSAHRAFPQHEQDDMRYYELAWVDGKLLVEWDGKQYHPVPPVRTQETKHGV